MRRKTKLVPMAAILRVAQEIADKFHPEKILLFGSYAYGQPHEHSDVDMLVVMPAYNETNQEIRILLAVEHPFSLDLVVRTPENLKWRLEEGDWFLREVVGKGRVLYGQKRARGGRRPGRSPVTRPRAVARVPPGSRSSAGGAP